MDTITKINYSDYSIEELVKLCVELNNIIDQKKAQTYEMRVSKIIYALYKMAEDYPYEKALYSDEEITWEELYDMFAITKLKNFKKILKKPIDKPKSF